jgi:dTDP-4-dehydrorhamnose 3,5-epimerase-like enzyme
MSRALVLIPGDIAVDDRGSLSFVNDFHFEHVVRFYRVSNFSTSVIRAWHGHKKEAKYVYVVSGSAIVAAVPFDHDVAPNKAAPVQRHVLSSAKPRILYIPPGFANGFRPLQDDTVILFFSTSTLEETKGDDFRFPVDYWGAGVWEVESR